MTEKRRRGRPAGTEINDNEALARIADLLLASPRMKLSEAIRTVYMAGKYKEQSRRATEERWRTKYNERRPVLMEAATKRKAAKEVRPTTSGSVYPMGTGQVVSMASLRNAPHSASSAAYYDPMSDAVTGAYRSTIDMATEKYRNTIADAARAMSNPLQDAVGAAMRETQRAADQFRAAFGQVGYGSSGPVGATYEVMRQIEEQRRAINDIKVIDEQRRAMNEFKMMEEQRRLMDQFNNANRSSFWPYR